MKSINLFNANAESDGTVIGASESYSTLDQDVYLVLLNAGGAVVKLEARNAASTGAWLTLSSGITTGQIGRIRVSSGHEYRFNITSAGSSAVDAAFHPVNDDMYFDERDDGYLFGLSGGIAGIPKPPSDTSADSRKSGIDTLADSSAALTTIDFDTGDFDNKIITLTDTNGQSILPTFTRVGEYNLTIKNPNNIPISFDYPSVSVDGFPPSLTADLNFLKFFYDGTNVSLVENGLLEAENYKTEILQDVDILNSPIFLTKQADESFDETLRVYLPTKGVGWYRWSLEKDSDVTNRYSLRDLIYTQLLSWFNVDDFTLTGSWNEFDSSTAVSGGWLTSRGLQATTAGNTITFTFTGDGDVYLAYGSRNNGMYAEIDIDGNDQYVSHLPLDGVSGNRYVDSYNTNAALVHDGFVLIGRNLPPGSHTVTITSSAQQHPSSAGTRLYISAIGVAGSQHGSIDNPNTLAPKWQATQAYTEGDEIRVGGWSLRATNTGTSGGAIPDHTLFAQSSDVVDGGVTWRTVKEESRVKYRDQSLCFPSEFEFAANITINSVTEDMGGQAHQRNPVTSTSILLDGVELTNPIGDNIHRANKLEFIEDTNMEHSEAAGGTYGSARVHRIFEGNVLTVENTFTFTEEVSAEWFYVGMQPYLYYDFPENEYAFTDLRFGALSRNFDDYDGVELRETLHVALVSSLTGVALGDTIRWTMLTDAESVNEYKQANTKGFILYNTDENPYNNSIDVKGKNYFTRLGAGAVIPSGSTFKTKVKHVFG